MIVQFKGWIEVPDTAVTAASVKWCVGNILRQDVGEYSYEFMKRIHLSYSTWTKKGEPS